MKVISKGDWASEAGKTFTGPTRLERMLPAQQEGGAALSLVRFRDGAVTNWHTHAGEQVLVIVEGQGRAGSESETLSFSTGDVVYTPPGQRHWHGAQAGHDMAHLSFTTGGPPTWDGPPDVNQ
ncbi:MAG TPA: cupin domain-containing protein [Thermomicrobiaceae bacterium]|nr:cupin domain-containing protein [Thermomicrobiaceae bacterium]